MFSLNVAQLGTPTVALAWSCLKISRASPVGQKVRNACHGGTLVFD